MRRAPTLVVLLAMSGCPPGLELEGKLCAEAEACPSGLVCFNGHCRTQRCDPDQLGTPCTAGVGACAFTGTFSCEGGEQVCTGTAGAPVAESCNGVDDDCDGVIDDGPRDAGDACLGGLGVCRSPGVALCADAGWACVTSGPQPSTELCGNGLDDDCDGFVDDGCLSTLAGSGPPGDLDGPLEDAMLARPYELVSDGRGNLFVADSSNNKVKVIRADGGIWTVAGNGSCGAVDGPLAVATFCQPTALELTPAGDLYVSDTKNRRIRLIRGPLTVQGTVETRWFPDAGLIAPRGLQLIADGGLFIADVSANHIFLANARGITILGAGPPNNTTPGLDEGTFGSVELWGPTDVAALSDNVLLVAEQGSHRIRRVTLDGTLSTTLAGALNGANGANDGMGTSARLNQPQQLLLDLDAGRVLVAELANNLLRSVPLDPTQRTSRVINISGGTGVARLSPTELAVAEVTTHTVRRVTMFDDAGVFISNLVGTGATDLSHDGDASYARLQNPDRMTLWPGNGLVFTESTSVRLLTLDAGRVITLVGAGPLDAGLDGRLGLGGRVGRPLDVKSGPDGGLYITDFDNNLVRVIDFFAQRIDTFAGPGARVDTTLNRPFLLAFGKSPNGEDLMFVTEGSSASPALRRFELQSGRRTLLAGLDSGVAYSGAIALAAGENGAVVIADGERFARRIAFDGSVTPVFDLTSTPPNIRGFALDASGRVVFARVRRVQRGQRDGGSPELLFDSQTYPLDSSTIPGVADGPTRVGIVFNPSAVVLDGERVYISDFGNNRIRQLLLPH